MLERSPMKRVPTPSGTFLDRFGKRLGFNAALVGAGTRLALGMIGIKSGPGKGMCAMSLTVVSSQ